MQANNIMAAPAAWQIFDMPDLWDGGTPCRTVRSGARIRQRGSRSKELQKESVAVEQAASNSSTSFRAKILKRRPDAISIQSTKMMDCEC